MNSEIDAIPLGNERKAPLQAWIFPATHGVVDHPTFQEHRQNAKRWIGGSHDVCWTTKPYHPATGGISTMRVHAGAFREFGGSETLAGAERRRLRARYNV